MTVKWTKGPWIVGHLPYGSGDGYGYGGSPTVTIQGSDTLVLSEGAEGQANAHLIAAAPKLYAALAEVLAAYGEWVDGEGYDLAMVHRVEGILAEARGERNDH